MATLDEHLECAMCLSILQTPKLLPCGHSYCCECIQDLVDTARDKNRTTINCPECRVNHQIPDGGADGFPRNICAAGLIEATRRLKLQSLCSISRCEKPADADCSHCGGQFCGGCSVSHLKYSIMDNIIISEKLFSDNFIQQANDLKQKLLQIHQSIQSAKIEMTAKVRYHISELEGVLQASLSELDQHAAAVDARVVNLNEITAIQSFHQEAKELLFSLDNHQDLLKLLEESSRYANLISQHSQFLQHDLTSPLTCYSHDVELSEAINNYCTITFNVPPEFNCEGAGGPAEAPSHMNYTGRSVMTYHADVTNKVGSYCDLAVCPITGDIYVLFGGDNESCISIYRSDGTFDRDMMIQGECLWGITITDDRYIVTTFHHGVMVINQRGDRVRTFGSHGSGWTEFDDPCGVAYSRGHVYVADSINHRVQVLTVTGQYVREFGQDVLYRPHCIAVDNDGSVVVACGWDDGVVYIFDDGGEELCECRDVKVLWPRCVCVDQHGYILVVHDDWNGDERLDVYTSKGDHHATIHDPANPFTDIQGLAVTSTGGVVVLDRGREEIMFF